MMCGVFLLYVSEDFFSPYPTTVAHTLQRDHLVIFSDKRGNALSPQFGRLSDHDSSLGDPGYPKPGGLDNVYLIAEIWRFKIGKIYSYLNVGLLFNRIAVKLSKI